MPQLSEEQFLQRLGVNQLTPEDAAARLNQAEMSAERQIALQESAQRAAQDQASTLGGRLQIPGLTFQGNLEQRMAGGEQTLRSIAEKFIDNPEGQNAQRIEQIGAEGQFNRMLLAELQDASPKLSFTGDALTFAFEAAITGPQARGGLLAKSLQEAAIGGLFGATVPTATEGEKAAAVATGVLTGAVSPSIFAGVGRGLAMSREAQQNVLQHVRMMKQLNQSGLLTLGELTGRSSFRKIEAALDNIPFFGMAGFRDQQRARFRDMADTLVGRITGGVRGDVDDLAKKLASRYDKNQGIVEKMYDSIARRLDTPAAPRVDFKNMRAVAQELLGEERGLPQFIQDPRLKKSLSQILSDDRSFTFNAARKTLSRMKADVRGQFDNMGRQQSREVRASLVKLQSAM
ncbi:MAG: hypothetical protein KTR33_13855, partial [Gammaproteobacteria bacterium]|nr:hypothetical protein [Gammaproteobacteria bacterium]